MEMGTHKYSKSGDRIPVFSTLEIRFHIDELDVNDKKQVEIATKQLRDAIGEIEDTIKAFVSLPNNFRIETH